MDVVCHSISGEFLPCNPLSRERVPRDSQTIVASQRQGTKDFHTRQKLKGAAAHGRKGNALEGRIAGLITDVTNAVRQDILGPIAYQDERVSKRRKGIGLSQQTGQAPLRGEGGGDTGRSALPFPGEEVGYTATCMGVPAPSTCTARRMVR